MAQCQTSTVTELTVSKWESSMRIYLDTCTVSNAIVHNEPELAYGFLQRQKTIDCISTLLLTVKGRDIIEYKYPAILIESAAQGICVVDILNLYTYRNDSIYHFAYRNGCTDSIGWILRGTCFCNNWSSFSINLSKKVYSLRGWMPIYKTELPYSHALVSFISKEALITYPISMTVVEDKGLHNNIELSMLCKGE